MRIGLVYDLFEHYPWKPGDPPDADAEYEPEETVETLEAAIRLLGHESVRIGPPRRLLREVPAVDAAINIAESYGSRNREAHAPVLLELLGIPTLGSDALTLSVSLDKAWTKDLVQRAGVPTPPCRVFRPDEPVPDALENMTYPLFVKPRYEGTAKGILPSSRVETPRALRQEVQRIHTLYRQDALVETFIEGAEFTVGIVGHNPPRALPVLQRAVETQTGIGLHALERKGVPKQEWTYTLPGTITPELEEILQHLALKVHEKLECKDFSRVDFRVDLEGNPWFLEINPLPTFAPDGTFAILAEMMGRPYTVFLAEIIAEGLRRLQEEQTINLQPGA